MKIKTLVVDNNPVLLKAISSILLKEKCFVRSAENGLEALEILQDYSPDIVFTDLIMPLVSGEQLCRILRNTQKHKEVFIVVVSAIILEDKERILQEINCDECIAKGTIQEIRLHIREALESFYLKGASVRIERLKNAKIPAGLQASEVTGELLSDKRHMSRILANLNEGIIELSGKGKIVTANRAALNIFSCREETVIGKNILEVINWQHFHTAVHQWLVKQLVGKGMKQYQILENDPLDLGSSIVTALFIPVHETAAVFGLCIFRDISRQFHAEKHNKQIDDALKLVKKMDAISCMAGGVAHDFNNLLTVICGNLEIVVLHGEDDDCQDHVKRVEQARSAAMAAVDLTRQISCFSHFGITKRERKSIKDLVQNSARQYFRAKKGTYDITIIDNDCDVYVDSDEISQAIDNVLLNAQEASSEGVIQFTIEQKKYTSPHLMYGQYVPAGEYVRIDITDVGKGIEPELLLRIFDPYYSTKERGSLKGMGLGLTLVYATLRNHGGYVVVNSERYIGTTVSLYLPVFYDNLMIINGKQKRGAPKQTILLIEPDNQMAEIGKIMLHHLGFEVLFADKRENAIETLNKLFDNQLIVRPIVLLDISESNGESAIETQRLLHEIDPKLQIIAMSGTILDPIMESCKKYGFVNALPKPYTMDSLKHIINTAMLG